MCYNFIARTHVRVIASQLLFLSSHVHGALGGKSHAGQQIRPEHKQHAPCTVKREARNKAGRAPPKKAPPHLRRAGRPGPCMHRSNDGAVSITRQGRCLTRRTTERERLTPRARAGQTTTRTCMVGHCCMHGTIIYGVKNKPSVGNR